MKAILITLGLLFACTSRAQVTYQPDKVPFKCASVTEAQVEMQFSQFNCRGIFYANGAVELIFNGNTNYNSTVTTPGWSAQVKIVPGDFTQPTPYFCPVPSTRIAGCPNGSTPGTFSFTWSGTGSDGLVHTGSVSGTWFNEQYFCGGCRSGGSWYAPTLVTAALTVDN